tara:strand:- start:124 stop:291 length:168 start_codon:yes stop_codon:yes gene_type:complete
MYLPSGKIIKPRRERGLRAWFIRWFCCGIRQEREIMKIYLEINQKDEDEIWCAGI